MRVLFARKNKNFSYGKQSLKAIPFIRDGFLLPLRYVQGRNDGFYAAAEKQ